jgi:hypothetical protein
MRKFTATEAQDLCEIIEERSIDKSITFTSWVHLPETGRVHYEKSCRQ